ncbi:MAG: type II secretion system protein [Alphaproteobacteria bacterium]|nr:type II secretion system protein [Alphaproteobacteria bacterium]MBO5441711.1 type II secretion system protein [Alphaproteobacteria bacterium]
MIEMLGVLAIVGILSVGAIAGFQKAMRKHKINKLTEQYTLFIQEYLLKYKGEWARMHRNNGVYIASYLEKLGLPAGWKRVNDTNIIDSMNNRFSPNTGYAGFSHVGFDLLIQVAEANTQNELCRQFISNVILPFKEDIYRMWLYQRSSSKLFWYGTPQCSGNRNCLSNMTFQDIEDFCSSCFAKDENCSIAVYF